MATPVDAANNYYDVNTGNVLGQYYAQQRGPGDVVFGDPAAAADAGAAPPPTTPPGNGVDPTTNPYGTGYGQGPIGSAWVKPQGNYTQQVMQNTQLGQGNWGDLGGATINSPQAWQNFKFSNPVSQWQKNANALSGLDKFRYLFNSQTGGSIGHNATIEEMIRQGIDPAIATKVASTFGTGGGGSNYWRDLGLSSNPWEGKNGSLGMFQQGSQLFGTSAGANGGPNSRYLINDFGPGNWESAGEVMRQGTRNPDGSYQDAGQRDINNWFGQYEKDNNASFYGTNPGGNYSPNGIAQAALEAGWTPQNQGVGLDGAAAAARLANGTGGNANLIRGFQSGQPLAVNNTSTTTGTGTGATDPVTGGLRTDTGLGGTGGSNYRLNNGNRTAYGFKNNGAWRLAKTQ